MDGLTFDGCRSGGMPLIQISDDNPSGNGVSHFRNVKLVNWTDTSKSRALINRGGGPRPKPKTEKGVPVYVHDWFGPGRDALVVSTASPEFKADPERFHGVKDLTGDESRAAEVPGIEFPKVVDPVDDLPPTTVITHVRRMDKGKILVQGVSTDNGTITRVVVNGQAVKPGPQGEWEVVLPGGSGELKLSAHAEDAAGNIEPRPHELKLPGHAR